MSAINEAPDAATAALQYMMLAALAAASSVETVDLFIIEEAMTAIPKAGQVRKGATSRQPPSVLGMHRVSEDPSTFSRYTCGSAWHRHGWLPRRLNLRVRALRCT